MKEKILISAMVIIIAGSAFLGYLSFVDGSIIGRPIEISDSLELETVQEEYGLDERIEVIMFYCKNRDIPGVMRWHIIDSFQIEYPPKIGTLDVDCHREIIDIGRSPRSAIESKEVYLEGSIEYQVNDIRSIIIPLRTKPFKVHE